MSRPLFFNPNLLILFGVTLTSVMGVTIIAPVLPLMAEGLHISLGGIILVITAFTLPGIFLAPFLGLLADRFGRKTVLVPSLVLFGLAGTGCFFTTSFPLLVFLRFLQGLGAACLGSMNLTVISDLFQENDRIRAMGYNSAVLSVGTALYPLLGGLIALGGWNYPFLVSMIAFPVAGMVAFKLDSPRPARPGPMAEYITGSLRAIGRMDLIALYMSSLATFMLMYGVFISFIPFLMQGRFGSSPAEIGGVFFMASAATFLGSVNLGTMTGRIRLGALIPVSFLLYAISIAIMLPLTNPVLLIVPALVYGFANGINIPSTQAGIALRVPGDSRAGLMSLNSVVLRTGQTLGPLAAGAVHIRWGLQGVFVFGMALATITAAALFFLLGRRKECANSVSRRAEGN